MIEKESLNFLICLYNHLWLLRSYCYPSLEKNGILNVELAKAQTGQIFEKFSRGDNLRTELFWQKILIKFLNVKIPFFKVNFSKRL